MRYESAYGPVFKDDTCRDNYRNIVLFHAGGGLVVKLQAPALASYRKVCEIMGHPIPLTGSWRSCAYQTELHRSDPARYADPTVTLHCPGLAIDVSTAYARFDRASKLLQQHGWHRARPDDEPWHHSFRLDA